jgi:hypothetical protein
MLVEDLEAGLEGTGFTTILNGSRKVQFQQTLFTCSMIHKLTKLQQKSKETIQAL